MVNEQIARSAFEEFVTRSLGYEQADLKRGWDGAYIRGAVDELWQAWLGAFVPQSQPLFRWLAERAAGQSVLMQVDIPLIAEGDHQLAQKVLFRAGYLIALKDVAAALGWCRLADDVRHLAEEQKQLWDEAVVNCNKLSQLH